METASGYKGAEAVTVLETKGLSISINGQTLVHDIDLSLKAGKVLGLCGESGAGKSMAAMAIAGLLPEKAVLQGQIRLGDQNLDTFDDSDYSRIRGAEIGMVFQEPQTALNPLMTIGDQVAEVFRQHLKLDRQTALQRAEIILRRVGLPAEEVPLNRLPDELSGGQRQRVVIAIAIALEPRLIIADEPTTALDTTTQLEILNLLKELVTKHNIALLLITHDLGVMARMADDLLIMHDGALVETGPVSILDNSLSHPHARALVDASRANVASNKRTVGSSPLITFDRVGYTYPNRRILSSADNAKGVQNISFTLHKGEILGLVGSSGSGKTTLSRLMLGLLSPDSGSIQSKSEIRPGAVFQDPYASFNPRHTVGRLVTEPFAGLANPPSAIEQEAIASEMLDAVEINPDWQNRLIHEFSGGQRQRIAFARAMITHPGLIILDEPVSALDATLRKKLLTLMADRASAHGIACVFVSHDLSVVRTVSPRVMVMSDGRIVEDGPVDDVLSKPDHPATRALVDASLDLQKERQTRVGIKSS